MATLADLPTYLDSPLAYAYVYGGPDPMAEERGMPQPYTDQASFEQWYAATYGAPDDLTRLVYSDEPSMRMANGWQIDPKFGMTPDQTQIKVEQYDPNSGAYVVKLKTSDKEGTLYAYQPDGQGGYMLNQTPLGAVEWDTNTTPLKDPMFVAMLAAVVTMGAAAAMAPATMGGSAALGGTIGATDGLIAAGSGLAPGVGLTGGAWGASSAGLASVLEGMGATGAGMLGGAGALGTGALDLTSLALGADPSILSAAGIDVGMTGSALGGATGLATGAPTMGSALGAGLGSTGLGLTEMVLGGTAATGGAALGAGAAAGSGIIDSIVKAATSGVLDPVLNSIIGGVGGAITGDINEGATDDLLAQANQAATGYRQAGMDYAAGLRGMIPGLAEASGYMPVSYNNGVALSNIDPLTGEVSFTLNQPQEEMYRKYLGASMGLMDEFANTDPNSIAQRMYDERQALIAPQREQQQQGLLQQLYNKGGFGLSVNTPTQLGTMGLNPYVNSFAAANAQTDKQMAYDSWQQGQTYLDSLLNRQRGLFGDANNILSNANGAVTGAQSWGNTLTNNNQYTANAITGLQRDALGAERDAVQRYIETVLGAQQRATASDAAARTSTTGAVVDGLSGLPWGSIFRGIGSLFG